MGTKNLHRAFVRTHGPALRDAGLPLAAFEDPGHWAYFLEHGCLHEAQDPGRFSVEALSREQQRALRRILEALYPDREPTVLGDLRRSTH